MEASGILFTYNLRFLLFMEDISRRILENNQALSYISIFYFSSWLVKAPDCFSSQTERWK